MVHQPNSYPHQIGVPPPAEDAVVTDAPIAEPPPPPAQAVPRPVAVPLPLREPEAPKRRRRHKT